MKITKMVRLSGSPKSLKLSILALLVLVVLIVIVLFTGCSTPLIKTSVDINQYVKATVDGYDGYGTISFNIDYDTIVNESKASAENKLNAMDILSTFEPFVAKYDGAGTLKEGDTVVVEWEKNQEVVKTLQNYLGIKFSFKNYSHIVDGLISIKDYDPFVDIVIKTDQSSSGNGKIFAQIIPSVDKSVVWKVEHDGENGALSNGDLITLSISDSIDIDAFAKKTGMRITRTSMQYKINCLGEYAHNGEIFNHIGETEEAALAQVMNDWVVAALNDENLNIQKRTFTSYGYIYYTNTAPNADEDEIKSDDQQTSMLFAIYKVIDPFIPEGYYVFLGLDGKFSYDVNGLYINDGEPIPNSFVYYEKETVRYSQKFGWRQGDEAMGFLHFDMPYAGHMDVMDTYSFIEEMYGKKYEHRYTSSQISSELSERHNTVNAEGD